MTGEVIRNDAIRYGPMPKGPQRSKSLEPWMTNYNRVLREKALFRIDEVDIPSSQFRIHQKCPKCPTGSGGVGQGTGACHM